MPHIHTADGQFDFTVSGYLVYKNKTLLIRHKYLPIWTPPAGHIELDQTPVDALYAEIKEEAGIDRNHLTLIETHQETNRFARGEATRLPVPFDVEYHQITDKHRHINLAYILTSDTNNVEPGPGESNTFKWFSADELRNFDETNASIISSALYALEYIAEEDRG
ncbi:MAG TPA: NUDIX domain-containing protein [Candidatus Saccharimonadaceae bacterium]|nr:NUDIX domain-containing protein [Candidatus Saccharimonadaceae bacterium]